jgi:hypothetical protein
LVKPFSGGNQTLFLICHSGLDPESSVIEVTGFPRLRE